MESLNQETEPTNERKAVSGPSTSIDSVRIQNYKNIRDSGTINLNEVTALLGKNEAGKTSILEGIRMLSNEDRVQQEDLHDDVRNENLSSVPIIEAKFHLTRDIAEQAYSIKPNELERIDFPAEFDVTKYADGTRRFSSKIFNAKRINRVVEMAGEVADTREKALNALSGRNEPTSEVEEMVNVLIQIKNYEIQSGEFQKVSGVVTKIEEFLDLSEDCNVDSQSFHEIVSGFREHYEDAQADVKPPDPTILFYDDIDLISDEYQLDGDISRTGCKFEQMLSIGDFSYSEFTEVPDQTIYLDSVSNRVEDRINKLWSQKEIELDIRVESEEKLKLYIRDLTASDLEEVRRNLTKPSGRSYGFRWFFSFFVDTIASAHQDEIDEKILLFDDPAVYLHPEGKRDWLDTVEQISDTEQIIYTAHSPYLIDKSQPTRIRIVEDKFDKGTVVREDVLDPDADPDALEPLRNSLGINLGDSPFLSKKTVLVEGPSDYYIFTGVINYFSEYEDREHFEFDKISINPTNGAEQMPHRASWLSAQNIDFAMLLDSDEGGNSVYEKIENNRFEGVEANKAIRLKTSSREEGLTIEDMFPPSYYIKSFNSVFNNISNSAGVNYRNITAAESDSTWELGVQDLTSERWEIGPVEYNGHGLTECLEELIQNQPISEHVKNSDGDIILHKRSVAENIHKRLNRGDAPQDNLKDFNRVLGEIGNALDF